MERRKLGVGLLALIGTMLLLVSSASAHSSAVKAATDPVEESAAGAAGCSVHSLPSFMDQGEFGTSSSVADIIEVSCNPEYAAEEEVQISDHELYSQCKGDIAWGAPYEASELGEIIVGDALKGKGKKLKKNKKNAKGDVSIYEPGITVYTDNDGNATVALLGGPGCTAGTSLVTADLVNDGYETVTTSFTVKAPHTTTPGLTLLPSSQVEDDYTSSAVTIAEVEFPPVDAEKYVDINSPQLYNRCGGDDVKLLWIGPDGTYAEIGPDLSGRVQLDNDGNAFVVLVGTDSCAAGPSLVEASLEAKPYTTYTKVFNILPPSEGFTEGV